MKSSIAAASVLLPSLLCVTSCTAVKREVPLAHRDGAEPAFAMIASLAGNWHGTARNGAQEFPVDVSYEVTSNGTVVMERLFRGTPHEMVTMYHRDGDRLLLTHYCSAGNQPRMQLVGWSLHPEPTASFSFVDATNYPDDSKLVMHDARITKINDHHATGTWTAWVGGKADHSANFDLRRVMALGY